MKAVVATTPGGPEVLSLADLPDPQPGPGEVAIAIVASAVNRADLLQRQGNYAPPPGASDVLGLECSGTIAASERASPTGASATSAARCWREAGTPTGWSVPRDR